MGLELPVNFVTGYEEGLLTWVKPMLNAKKLLISGGLFLAVAFLILGAVPQKQFLVNIPVHFGENEIPTADVSIKGHSYQAWIDIGRRETMIRFDILKGLPYHETGRLAKTQGFNQPVQMKREVELPPLVMGGHQFPNLKAFIGPVQSSAFSIGNDGKTISKARDYPPLLVGNEVFEEGLLLIDYPKGLLQYGTDENFFQKEGIKYKSWVKVPFVHQHGIIRIEGENQGEITGWIVDTGTSLNLLSRANESKGDLMVKSEPDEEILFGGETFHLDELYITNRPLVEGTVGILGAPFLFEHRVLLNFKNNTMYIEKVPPKH